MAGTTSTVLPGVQYYHKVDHHRDTPGKSKWTVTCTAEEEVFRLGYAQGWVAKDGWGLHLVSGNPDYLGLAADRERQLFFAKFVRGYNGVPWHGYPADYLRTNADTPPRPVMKDWIGVVCQEI